MTRNLPTTADDNWFSDIHPTATDAFINYHWIPWCFEALLYPFRGLEILLFRRAQLKYYD